MNLIWGSVRSNKKIGSQRFSGLCVYWMQTDRQVGMLTFQFLNKNSRFVMKTTTKKANETIVFQNDRFYTARYSFCNDR